MPLSCLERGKKELREAFATARTRRKELNSQISRKENNTRRRVNLSLFWPLFPFEYWNFLLRCLKLNPDLERKEENKWKMCGREASFKRYSSETKDSAFVVFSEHFSLFCLHVDIWAWLELDFSVQLRRMFHTFSSVAFDDFISSISSSDSSENKNEEIHIPPQVLVCFIFDINWQRCENIIVILMTTNALSSDSRETRAASGEHCKDKEIMSCNFYDSCSRVRKRIFVSLCKV